VNKQLHAHSIVPKACPGEDHHWWCSYGRQAGRQVGRSAGGPVGRQVGRQAGRRDRDNAG
jgi:hypothetical protein